MQFSDRLIEAIARKNSRLVVGIDPHLDLLPPPILERVNTSNRSEVAKAILNFSTDIIDAVSDVAVAIKPQVAFFERLGGVGFEILETIIMEAKKRDLLTISDSKRGDIGSTAQAYADYHLGPSSGRNGSLPGLDADAVTLSPYLGGDSLDPFVSYIDSGKGMFLLAKTSNRGSADLQDRLLQSEPNMPLYRSVGIMADQIAERHEVGSSGYASIGLVIGATFPEQAKLLRVAFPRLIFLIPGVGAQGAKPSDLKSCFDSHGMGAIVNASRSVIFAYRDNNSPTQWKACAREAAAALRDQLNLVLGQSRP
ncbi:MAG: orotidine-5'-phosphate decarboxylase [Bradyrhizobium sp.]|uniref:orotidine-5'-phosphate decarboxylase n=1 Tax=Bradyrhizobium sp. TaxID=376 RepID=UPI0027317369|nr:orotidine-5'-phosphate decarboxylase [Bradyrhizobium sp.]MDP1866088.1 orotidine-5'-phosphate decarboxylase [Bradyrhizobium sp.]